MDMPDEIYMSSGPTPGEPYWCDFCNETPVVWLFGCRDHTQGSVLMANPDEPPIRVTGEAFGDWLACEGCAELVRSTMREALAERSYKLHFERKRTPPIHRPPIREAVLQAHGRFWANREPERDRPLNPGEEIRPDATA
jgi:hypothetical protein